MSDKLYIQDLVHLLSEKHHISKKEAESFLKAFFSLIEDGLDKDKSVKIKGLGTFKLIRVESRESIDVNTGKRCVIEGHTKISFNPDTTVKELINKPFSHFETVILNENVVFDEYIPNKESDREKIPEQKITEEIEGSPVRNRHEERKEIAVDDQTVEHPVSLEDSVIVPDMTSGQSEEPESEPVADNNKVEMIHEKVNDSETKPLEKEEVIDRENADLTGLPKEKLQDHLLVAEESEKNNFGASEAALSFIKPSEEVYSKDPVVKETDPDKKKKKSNFPAYVLIAGLTIFITVCIIYFIFNPHLFDPIFTSGTSSESQSFVENYTSTEEQDLFIEDVVDEEERNEERDLEKEHALIHNEEITGVEEETFRAQPETILADTTKTIITGVRKGYEDVKADSTSYRIIGTMAIHTIRGGETLTKVSNSYYGTKDLWPYLVMHNKDIIKNPDNVPSGTTIRIPALRDK